MNVMKRTFESNLMYLLDLRCNDNSFIQNIKLKKIYAKDLHDIIISLDNLDIDLLALKECISDSIPQGLNVNQIFIEL